MVHREDMFLQNLEGTIYNKDVPVLYINITNGELVDSKKLNWVGDNRIPDFVNFPVNYHYVNEYFKDRVVLDGAMWLKGYLEALGLDHYDFEQIVKRSSGWNPRDRQWIKFDGGRFQSYDQIIKELHLKR